MMYEGIESIIAVGLDNAMDDYEKTPKRFRGIVRDAIAKDIAQYVRDYLMRMGSQTRDPS